MHNTLTPPTCDHFGPAIYFAAAAVHLGVATLDKAVDTLLKDDEIESELMDQVCEDEDLDDEAEEEEEEEEEEDGPEVIVRQYVTEMVQACLRDLREEFPDALSEEKKEAYLKADHRFRSEKVVGGLGMIFDACDLFESADDSTECYLFTPAEVCVEDFIHADLYNLVPDKVAGLRFALRDGVVMFYDGDYIEISKAPSASEVYEYTPADEWEISKLDYKTRLSLAQKDDLPEEAISALISAPEIKIRRALASHCETLDDGDLALLANDDRPEVRAEVAKRGHYECRTGKRHYDDDYEDDLDWGDDYDDYEDLFRQKAPAPEDIMRKLAEDPVWYVRRAVAGNPLAPAGILSSLVTDPHVAVRVDLAWNEATPHEILRRLAEDSHPDVAQGATANPNAPGDLKVQVPKTWTGGPRPRVR